MDAGIKNMKAKKAHTDISSKIYKKIAHNNIIALIANDDFAEQNVIRN